MEKHNFDLIQSAIKPSVKVIADKVYQGKRISEEDAMTLYNDASLGFLGVIADNIRIKKNKQKVFYVRNYHVEPSNKCSYDCVFCSYSEKSGELGWEFNRNEIVENIRLNCDKSIVELHVVGSAHPERDASFYGQLLKDLKTMFPAMHLKAFSAVELSYMFKKSEMEILTGLRYLKECGLDSIPGGGAEIFDEGIRKQICSEKADAKEWLDIHETAHKIGLPSNATMLYGHIEDFEHRIHHLQLLRDLQDRTNGFNAFIPLKFKNKNNQFRDIKETSLIDDLRTFAISRIYLDNFDHIKAYWPMIGKDFAQLSLSFGVDDLDGTINDSTKIYSRAGAEDSPSMTVDEIRKIILQVGRVPVERDALYNSIS